MTCTRSAGMSDRAPAFRPAVLDHVERELALAEPPKIINVVGPLGVGKSTLLRSLNRYERSVIVDDFDGRLPEAGVVVVATRTPLVAQLEQPAGPAEITIVPMPRWTDAEIEALAGASGIHDAVSIRTIVRLSGGLPLAAAVVARALAGTEPDPPFVGRLADLAVQAVIERLAVESPPAEAARLLGAVAACGPVNVEALAQIAPGASEATFDALAALSIVSSGELGLELQEPYRTLFDLSYHWRRPSQRHTDLARQLTMRRRHIARLIPRGPISPALIRAAMRSSLDPVIAEEFRPVDARETRLRTAVPGDEDAIDRLVWEWAPRVGADPARCRRVLERWLPIGLEHFTLACSASGRPVALLNLVPIREDTLDSIQPLLQHYTEPLGQNRIGDRDRPAGIFAGFLTSEGPSQARALLLTQTLHTAYTRGRLVVATPWPEFQRLAERATAPCGQVGEDPYACGRLAKVYDLEAAPAESPVWIDRTLPQIYVTRASAPSEDDVLLARRSLEQFHQLGHQVADLPMVLTPSHVRQWILTALRDLISSPDERRRQAGQAVSRYYVERLGSHEAVAHSLHLSRATYFRRLNAGISMIASAHPINRRPVPAGGSAMSPWERSSTENSEDPVSASATAMRPRLPALGRLWESSPARA